MAASMPTSRPSSIQAHIVSTGSWSTLSLDYDEDLKGKPKPTGPLFGSLSQVMTSPGDLAVEMVTVKKSKFVGFSYLSGAAIQLNCYDEGKPDWFEPASSNFIEIPERPQRSAGEEAAAAFQKTFIGTLIDIKYGAVDVVAFKYGARDNDEAKGFCDFLYTAWGYAPVDDGDQEDLKATAHFFGNIDYGDGSIGLHFHPPQDAANYAATAFQNALVIELAQRRAEKREEPVKKPKRRKRK